MKTQRELLKQELEVMFTKGETGIDQIIDTCRTSFEIEHQKKPFNISMLMKAFRSLPPARPNQSYNLAVHDYLAERLLQDPTNRSVSTLMINMLPVKSMPYMFNDEREWHWEIDWRY